MSLEQRIYEPPCVTDLGAVTDVTRGGDGNDPCRYNDPRGTDKQTGIADLILGQANLVSCSA